MTSKPLLMGGDRSAMDEEDLMIPKSDTEAGPGLVRLADALKEDTDPQLTFNEHR